MRCSKFLALQALCSHSRFYGILSTPFTLSPPPTFASEAVGEVLYAELAVYVAVLSPSLMFFLVLLAVH